MIKAGDFVVYCTEIFRVADSTDRFVLLETPNGLRGAYTPVRLENVILWRETAN